MNQPVELIPLPRQDIAGEGELVEREARIERAQRNAYYEIGLDLRAIRDGGLYKVKRTAPVAGHYSFQSFEEYVETRWDLSRQRVSELIAAAIAVQKMTAIADVLPARESHVRPLLKLESDADRASAWSAVVEKHGTSITAKDVEAEVELLIAANEKDWITLPEWEVLSADERSAALRVSGDKEFNKQDNESIEWARWSWNPITGCRHDCPYCYARDIAARFYPQGFEPSIYPPRLSAPANMKVPPKAETDPSYRNVFVCSMADLFGRWVPDEWIEAVFDQVRQHPKWNFLFLTKFPKRMAEFKIPRNAWMGTTVDLQARVKAAEDAFAKIDCEVKWLSVEPMLQPLVFKRLEVFNWMVIGGASPSVQTPAWMPPLDWMVNLHTAARAAGLKLYYKTNAGLHDDLRIKEFPWQVPKQKALPPSLMYLGQDKDKR
jgi:protein gp37